MGRIADAVRCTAKNRQGGRCGLAAVPGATVCGRHGGRAPQVTAAAARRLATAQAAAEALQARAILGCHDVKPIEDPIRELAALGGEILDLKDILAAKVAELRDWTTSDSFDREGIKAVLGAYERALERCQRLLVDMAKLDLDTRLVRLSEAQADMLERVIEVVLALPELGLSKGQRKIAREGVVRELHTLAAAGA